MTSEGRAAVQAKWEAAAARLGQVEVWYQYSECSLGVLREMEQHVLNLRMKLAKLDQAERGGS